MDTILAGLPGGYELLFLVLVAVGLVVVIAQPAIRRHHRSRADGDDGIDHLRHGSGHDDDGDDGGD